MADTANLTLAKPDLASAGWGAILNTLLDRLDLLLGVPLLAGEDPNALLIEGYKNAIIIDTDSTPQIVWVCTANGTGNWIHLSLAIFDTLAEQTQRWNGAQLGKWRTESPVGSTIDLDRTDSFVYINLSVDAEVQLPTGVYDLEDGQVIVLAVETGPAAQVLTFDLNYYKFIGGVQIPVLPDDSLTYFSLVRERATAPDRWVILPAYGYEPGII